MTDPRMSIIDVRLKQIGRIIAVSSSKGGVGKSLIATTLALALSKRGHKVGLFDLDFTSPCTHILLDVKNLQPIEEKGLIPPKVQGLEYMSLIYYSSNQAIPLRGGETSNALIELLAVTIWGKLDYLVIDMPPGLGDAVLDLIRLLPRIEFLIVTTSSQLAFESVRKQLSLLKDIKVPIVGIIENMKLTGSKNVRQQAENLGLKLLAEIPFDLTIEPAIGDPEKLQKTVLAQKVLIVAQII